jgi:hypothetical protein
LSVNVNDQVNNSVDSGSGDGSASGSATGTATSTGTVNCPRGGTGTGGGNIPDSDTQTLFNSLVDGKPFGQQTLIDLAPTLAQYCIELTPANATGDRTKIGDPISHRWTRVGFGEGHWVWIVENDVYTPNCSE